MRAITTFISTILCLLLVTARDATAEVLWGYIDRTGQLVIKPIYKDAGKFSEGLARVVRQGENHFCFIDKKGEIAFETKHPYATHFCEGLCPFGNDAGKWGYMDRSGKTVIAEKFDRAQDFHEGLAAVESAGKLGFIDKNGNLAVAPQFSVLECKYSEGLAGVFWDGGQGFVDRAGKKVFEIPYSRFDSFSEKMAMVGETDTKWGYMSRDGQMVIKPQFVCAEPFQSGLAAVASGEVGSVQYGFIDKSGNWVIKPVYDYAGSFHDGLACVRLNGKCGFVNRWGQTIIPLKYKEGTLSPGHFNDGLHSINQAGKWGWIDTQGRMAIKPKYSMVEDFHEGLAAVSP